MVLVCIAFGERCRCAVERGAASEIRGNRDPVTRARVGSGECPAADPAVGRQRRIVHQFELGRLLLVPELPDVEVLLLPVDGHDPFPAQHAAPAGKSCSDDPAFVIRSFFDVIESSRRRPNSWPRRVRRSRSNRPATGHPEQSGLHFGRPPIRSAMLFESSWEAHVSLFGSLRSSLTSPTGERLVRSGRGGRPDLRRLPGVGPGALRILRLDVATVDGNAGD